jgi:hypothetical protein
MYWMAGRVAHIWKCGSHRGLPYAVHVNLGGCQLCHNSSLAGRIHRTGEPSCNSTRRRNFFSFQAISVVDGNVDKFGLHGYNVPTISPQILPVISETRGAVTLSGSVYDPRFRVFLSESYCLEAISMNLTRVQPLTFFRRWGVTGVFLDSVLTLISDHVIQ